MPWCSDSARSVGSCSPWRRGRGPTARDLRRGCATHASPLAALRAYADCFAQDGRVAGALAHHLAYLQIDLTDAEFHRHARTLALATGDALRELLDAAIAAGELAPAVDTGTLAQGPGHLERIADDVGLLPGRAGGGLGAPRTSTPSSTHSPSRAAPRASGGPRPGPDGAAGHLRCAHDAHREVGVVPGRPERCRGASRSTRRKAWASSRRVTPCTPWTHQRGASQSGANQ